LAQPARVPIDLKPVENAGFNSEIQQRLIDQSGRQVREFARTPGKLRKGKVLDPKLEHPRTRAARVIRVRNYRIVANIIEEDARKIISRNPAVTVVHVSMYKDVARAALGVLWKMAKTEKGRDALLRKLGTAPLFRGRKSRDSPQFPEAIANKLTARAARWPELIPELIAQIQIQTLVRFRQLLSSHPELLKGATNV
jgi:hypothetical protein